MIDWTEEKLIEAGYRIQNALIINVDLSTVNFCSADLAITLEGDGWGVVIGGYKLAHAGTYIKFDEVQGHKEGFELILKIMWVLDSDSLFDLKGKYVRVATKGWGDSVKIIGHIIKDQWFDYGSFFKKENDNEK